MPEAETQPPASDKELEQKQAALHRRRIRRRIVGTASIAAVLLFLWQLGQDNPPLIIPQQPPSQPPTMSSPGLTDAAEQLQNAPDFAEGETAPPLEFSDSVSVAVVTVSSQSTPTMVEIKITTTVAADGADDAATKTPNADDSGSADHDPLSAVLAQLDATDDAAQLSPFVVQIGAFASIERAQQQAAALRRHKFIPHLQQSADKTLYRVWAVGYQTRAAAERAKQKIQRLLKIKPIVIPTANGSNG